MKSWTGTEKLTRGWWVNRCAPFMYDNKNETCGTNDTFWTPGPTWSDGTGAARFRAPADRELVGFTIKDPGNPACPYAPSASERDFGKTRHVWPTYAEAMAVYRERDYRWSRIRPVTRRKRETTILPHEHPNCRCSAAEVELTYDPKLQELTYKRQGELRRLTPEMVDLLCRDVRDGSRGDGPISLSDALSDQLRGCLRVGR